MAPKAGGGAAKKRKGATGYVMPDHLDEGTVLTGLTKKKWTLGRSIGTGGFGEIYLAKEGEGVKVGDDASYVVKIEPKENGPLFVEMHFYLQVGTPDQVKDWPREANIPLLRGNGSYQHGADTYRFLVIDRLGTDLDKVFQNGKHPLPLPLAGTLAVQVINALEYIHSKGYTHNDVKAANLLCGYGKRSHTIFLVDFGLCVKYNNKEGHKEYKADPKRAHDGTIEYLSRDAHLGCTGRRSDLEVLCFNLLHWTTGSLPWLKCLTKPTAVEAEKKAFMADLTKNAAGLPSCLVQLFKYVAGLGFDARPDYDRCRGFFAAEMRQTGGKINLQDAAAVGINGTPARKKSAAKKSASPRKSAAAVAGAAKKRTSSLSPVKKTTKKATPNCHSSESDEDEFLGPTPPPKTAAARGTPRRLAGLGRGGGSGVASPRQARQLTPQAAAAGSKFRDTGCQTSPAFVIKAQAMKTSQGTESIPSISSGSEGSPQVAKNKATIDDKKKTITDKKRKDRPKANGAADSGAAVAAGIMDNPTPAMLAILKRKQEVEAEKAAKKSKK